MTSKWSIKISLPQESRYKVTWYSFCDFHPMPNYPMEFDSFEQAAMAVDIAKIWEPRASFEVKEV